MTSVKEFKLKQMERIWQLAALTEVKRTHRGKPRCQWSQEKANFYRSKIYEEAYNQWKRKCLTEKREETSVTVGRAAEHKSA